MYSVCRHTRETESSTSRNASYGRRFFTCERCRSMRSQYQVCRKSTIPCLESLMTTRWRSASLTFWSHRHPKPAQRTASARIPPMVKKIGAADCTSVHVSVVTSLQIEMNSPEVSRSVDAKSTWSMRVCKGDVCSRSRAGCGLKILTSRRFVRRPVQPHCRASGPSPTVEPTMIPARK